MTHIPIDYHMHSNYSYDCKATMHEMCLAALAKGISEIAFTDHFDQITGYICVNYYKPAAFFSELEAVRAEFSGQGLTIRAGVEVGEIHLYRAEVDAVLHTYPYDVVLGSLHWTGGESVFDMSYFQKRTPRESAQQYWAEMVEMILGGGFNILSHVDVFKRFAFRLYKSFDITHYEDLVRPVWEACLQMGVVPEINTAALRLAVNQAHPTLIALQWYHDMGGQLISLGSDSHHPSEVGYALDEALRLAQAAGIPYVVRFERRQIVEKIRIDSLL